MVGAADHGLADQLEPVQRPDGRQDVGRVGPLPATRLEQPARLAGLEQFMQQAFLGATCQQARAELAQHRVVKARVGQLEPEQVLPVDPAPDRLRGPPVGQVLAELQDGDQGQSPRRQPRLAEPGEEVGKVRVGEDGAELIAEAEEGIALAEGSLGTACRRSKFAVRATCEALVTYTYYASRDILLSSQPWLTFTADGATRAGKHSPA